MEYKKFGGVYAVRIDKGEEILAKLKEFAERENVAFARVSAIGAVGSFTAGVFDTKSKQYRANEFEGNFEIVSLSGTIDRMNGAFYAHLHMSVTVISQVALTTARFRCPPKTSPFSLPALMCRCA